PGQPRATERDVPVKEAGGQEPQGTIKKRGKVASAFARRSKSSDLDSRFDARTPAPDASPNIDASVQAPRQTARRSKPFSIGDRFDSRSSSTTAQAHEGGDAVVMRTHPDRPLDTYRSSNDDDNDESKDVIMQDASYDSSEYCELLETLKHEDASHLQEVGTHWPSLIIGRYDVRTSIDKEWSEYEDHQSSIILTSHGDEMWGANDFGMFNGVIRIAERQHVTSGGPVGFHWQGIENSEGVISYNDYHQTGMIVFTADGIVDGTFDGLYSEVSFQGLHVSEQRFRNERSYPSLRSQWDSY
ncbi:hypothetical protein LTR49_028909, partial [Elasticomyces elasticus]